MKPKRIELEGFTAYRKHTAIDFGDADLFVIVGCDRVGQVEHHRRDDLRPLRKCGPASTTRSWSSR